MEIKQKVLIRPEKKRKPPESVARNRRIHEMMHLRHSIRFRIIVVFTIFAALLSLCFALITLAAIFWTEDSIFERQVEAEAQFFLKNYVLNQNTPVPNSRYMSGYIGIENLPVKFVDEIERIQTLRKRFRVHKDHPVFEVNLESRTYHIAIHDLPGTDKQFFLVYNVSTLDLMQGRSLVMLNEYRERPLVLILIMSGVIVTILGMWLGKTTANRLLAPLIRLTQFIENTQFGTGNKRESLSEHFYHDEVGILAATLEESGNRIDEYIERERRFSRDASHELRTPTTVIKIAMELLQQMPEISESSRAMRTMRRISRAVNDMNHLIETFLWLGRADSELEATKPINMEVAAQQCIEQHCYLIEDKPVELKLDAKHAYRIEVPEQLFKIALSNLIRNAFQYTEKGEVTVKISPYSVSVTDTGRGIPEEFLKKVTEQHITTGEGFGLGLAIVHRISERLGWEIEIQSQLGEGTEVILKF